MGGRTSKIAGPSVVRRYPSRIPPQHLPSQATASTGPLSVSTDGSPTVHIETPATFKKSDAIKQDATDPDFASMLRTVGAVQISDAAKNFNLAGVNNPQLQTLSRRQLLEEQQFEEAANPETRSKRSWVDVMTVREILRLRDNRKWEPARIEKELGLADGLVERLGNRVHDV